MTWPKKLSEFDAQKPCTSAQLVHMFQSDQYAIASHFEEIPGYITISEWERCHEETFYSFEEYYNRVYLEIANGYNLPPNYDFNRLILGESLEVVRRVQIDYVNHIRTMLNVTPRLSEATLFDWKLRIRERNILRAAKLPVNIKATFFRKLFTYSRVNGVFYVDRNLDFEYDPLNCQLICRRTVAPAPIVNEQSSAMSQSHTQSPPQPQV